jgi:hypothetical protein
MTSWEALPDGVGTVLAVAGDVRVAAQSGRVRAWRGLEPLWVAEVDTPNPARPTIVADRVLWGPYAVDLDTGSVTELPSGRVPAEYIQTAHAWSKDGSVAVGAGRRLDPGGSVPPAAAWLLGRSGVSTLWSGADVPPLAVLVESTFVAIGHRNPDIYSVDGGLLRSLDGVTSPQRLDGGGGRLLVVEAGLLSVWDPSSGVLLGRAPGTWVDACLTPDGETLVAADMAGTIHRLPVATGLTAGVEEPADGPAIAVATDGRVLLASFAGLPGLRVRTL